MRQIIFFFVLTFFMSGLSGGISEARAQIETPAFPFVELHRGYYIDNGGITKKQTKVITSQAEYATELAIYTSAAPTPVDFTSGRVLLVDMGRRNTGGYSIAVTSVTSGTNSVTVNIQLTKPRENCITTQAITNPYQFVFIPTLEEILVSETIKLAKCS